MNNLITKKLKIIGWILLASTFILNANVVLAEHIIVRHDDNTDWHLISFPYNKENYNDDEIIQLSQQLIKYNNISTEQIITLAKTLKQELQKLGASEINMVTTLNIEGIDRIFIWDQNNQCFAYVPGNNTTRICYLEEKEIASQSLTIKITPNIVKADLASEADIFIPIAAVAAIMFILWWAVG